MASEQREYYLARAAEERSAAVRAPNATLARVHDDLAVMYDRMAKDADAALAPEPALAE
jgi:hypothetical protein